MDGPLQAWSEIHRGVLKEEQAGKQGGGGASLGVFFGHQTVAVNEEQILANAVSLC